jgi:hypothetical protein
MAAGEGAHFFAAYGCHNRALVPALRTPSRYNLLMAVRITTGQTALTTLALVAIVWAQDAHKPTAPPPPTAVTVPASIDHGRVMIDVDLPLADGSMLRVKGWVNDGNPDLYLSQRVAKLAGVELACAGDICSGKPPSQI